MAVEVNNADGTVGAVHATEEGQGDGVVTAEGDDTWQGLAVLGRSSCVGVGVGSSGEESIVTFLDLLECPGVVISVVMFWSASRLS